MSQKVKRLSGARKSIEQHQARIRDNVQAIERNSDLYRRYVDKLKSQEDEMETADKEIKTTVAEIESLRRKLLELVGSSRSRGKANQKGQRAGPKQKQQAPNDDLDDLFGQLTNCGRTAVV